MIEDAPRFPLYYVPPGKQRPAHIVHQGGIRACDGVGPMDAEQGERGGLTFGAAWDDRTLPLWKKTQAGWWVAIGDAAPHHVARLNPTDGRIIPGLHAGHQWLVPRLLAWRDGHGLVSALPLEFRDYTWQPPQRFANLMERLRTLLAWTPKGDVPAVPDQLATELAVEILSINYHISIHELTIAGWLSDQMVVDIIAAAGGVLDILKPAPHA